MHCERETTFTMGDEMKRNSFGHDHSGVRICGQCHRWFLSEGAHCRFCTSCRAEARSALDLPWVLRPVDTTTSHGAAVTAGEHVTG